VIEDELSFLHDYYYSSLPISYATSWLPVLSVSISLLSVGFCILAGMYIGYFLYTWEPGNGKQIACDFTCTIGLLRIGLSDHCSFGNLYVGAVPAFLLVALVKLSEVRDVASFMCSNWTKAYTVIFSKVLVFLTI
jgi:hypothetical protein